MQRVLGFAVDGVGLAGATVGAFLAVDSASKASNAWDRLAGAKTGARWDLAMPDNAHAKSQNQLGWSS